MTEERMLRLSEPEAVTLKQLLHELAHEKATVRMRFPGNIYDTILRNIAQKELEPAPPKDWIPYCDNELADDGLCTGKMLVFEEERYYENEQDRPKELAKECQQCPYRKVA